MSTTFRAGLRIAGLMLMAIAVAHCGDSNDNNDNTNPATPTRTPTPVSTATPTPVETATGAVSPTTTATPTGAACPSAISFEGDANTSILDAGWRGSGHDSKVIDKGKVTVQVTSCANATRPCGVCNLSGPISNPDAGAGTANNHRCSRDTSIECTSDTDCPSGKGTCVFFFGAPLPLAAGGVATCVANQIVGTVTGTANIETGEGASNASLIATVFSADEQSQPCPVCQNDPQGEDGQKQGTCSAGPRVGQPCDISGTSPTFGSTSFDCPPETFAVLANLPIKLLSTTGTESRSLSADSPDCSAGGTAGKKCQCDTCATADAEPCATSADCPAGRACGGLRCVGGSNNGAPCTSPVGNECPDGGFCTVPGEPTKPNDCEAGGTCEPIAGTPNRGECSPGPFETFCTPKETFRGCFADTDCPFAGDTCTLGKFRPCYLDAGAIGGSVTAVGQPDPPVNGVAHPTLAALFCIGPTSGAGVNSAAGLPGLGRLTLFGTATEIP